MNITVVVPGKPQGKQRARTVRTAKGVRTFTPEATVAYEDKIGWYYAHSRGQYFADKPVSVTIQAVFDVPVSFSKKKREKCLTGQISPQGKPDTDNIAKAVLDGLNDIAYKDDKQVVQLCVTKTYGEQPCLKIYVEEYEPCNLKI